jgi:hypothetical protein
MLSSAARFAARAAAAAPRGSFFARSFGEPAADKSIVDAVSPAVATEPDVEVLEEQEIAKNPHIRRELARETAANHPLFDSNSYDHYQAVSGVA